MTTGGFPPPAQGATGAQPDQAALQWSSGNLSRNTPDPEFAEPLPWEEGPFEHEQQATPTDSDWDDTYGPWGEGAEQARVGSDTFEDEEHAPAPPDTEPQPDGFSSLLGSLGAEQPAGHGAKPARQAPARREPRPKKARAERAPKSPRAPRERARRARSGNAVPRRALLGGLGVALLGAGVAFAVPPAWDSLFGDDEPAEAVAPTSINEVGAAVPPGWSQQVAWETPANVASNVAVRHGHVAFLNADGVLVVLDDTSGEIVLSSTPTGVSTDDSRVILTQVGETVAAVVVSPGSLLVWDVASDETAGRLLDIPTSAAVSSGGSNLLIVTSEQTFTLTDALGLTEVTGLPDGNVSLGLTTTGEVVSGSSGGGWGISNGTEFVEVQVEMAPEAEGDVMYPARASKGHVVAWAPTGDKSTRAVAIYDAESGALVASTTLPTADVNLGLALSVSDGARFAAAGNWLVDLDRGESEVVDGWTTTSIDAVGLYGTVDETSQVWSGSGQPTVLEDGVTIPWGVTSAGNGIVITSDEQGGTVLSAITPAT